jgi:deoxycytidylate deaminase
MNIKDKMYWEACREAANYSRCESRHLGAVLVNPKTEMIVAHGWNGPPAIIPACNEGWYNEEIGYRIPGCPRYHMCYKSGEGLHECIAVHAERSAILHAAARGISTVGLHMYMTCGISCKDCMVEILEAGIGALIVTEDYRKTGNWYDKRSEYLARQSKIPIREWDLEE